jgi:hypothetical protein
VVEAHSHSHMWGQSGRRRAAATGTWGQRSFRCGANHIEQRCNVTPACRIGPFFGKQGSVTLHRCSILSTASLQGSADRSVELALAHSDIHMFLKKLAFHMLSTQFLNSTP